MTAILYDSCKKGAVPSVESSTAGTAPYLLDMMLSISDQNRAEIELSDHLPYRELSQEQLHR